jgi:hypothetical protein
MADTIELKEALKLRGIDPDAGLLIVKGTPGAPAQDNFQLADDGPNLLVERFEENQWIARAGFGSSITTDDLILEDTSGNLSFIESGINYVIIKPADDGKGTIIGNIDGSIGLLHNGNLLTGREILPFDWIVIQPLSDETKTVTSASPYSFHFAATGTRSIKKIRFTANTAGVRYRISILLDDILKAQNVSEYEFGKGEGDITIAGVNEIDFQPYESVIDVVYTATIEVANDVEFPGHTYDIPGVTLGPEFYPVLEIFANEAVVQNVARYDAWQDSTTYTANESKIWQDNEVYICNTTGVQTTDFATNADKWDKGLIKNDYKQRQLIRSGVKGGFGVSSITTDTQIQITADSGGEFEVYFNSDSAIDSALGISRQIPDQVIDSIIDPIAKRFFVSVDSTGTMYTTETKIGLNDLTKVHLFTYTALNGTIIPETLLANPYLSYSDRSTQGILKTDGVRVNNLDISSQDNATLGIKSSQFDLIGNAINWENDKINPNVITVPAINPLSWAYLTQTITTPPAAGSSVLLDPANYDNAGTITAVGGGSGSSTVQLMMITPVKEFVILYGQEVFSTYDDALINARNIEFILPPALFEAVEVARIVLNKSATDSANINEVSIINTVAGAGGSGQIPASSEFLDGDFKLLNSTDQTKEATFEASKQATGTTKTHKLPSDNSELSTLDLAETFTAQKKIKDNLFRLQNSSDITKQSELLISDNQDASTTSSHILPETSGSILGLRNQEEITGNHTLTDREIRLQTVFFIDNGATNVTMSIPDNTYDGALKVTFVIIGTGNVQIAPLGSTTINGSGSSIVFTSDQYRIIDIIHRDDETQTWSYDSINYRKLDDVEFDDGTFKLIDNIDNTKIVQFDAANITPATTRTFSFPDENGTLALVPDNIEINYAYVKFNPNKLTNGEVSYRNAGVGFRVFRTDTGTFQIENDGTVLNLLPDNWAVRAASGSSAYIQVETMIAGINGYTATIETWGSGNGPQLGEPGTVTLFVRSATGGVTDVSNSNGHIYIKYVEI